MKIALLLYFLGQTAALFAQNSPAVVSVDINKTSKTDAYTVHVGIISPDTGCDQYADWWELVSPKGALIYRRILHHSHVKEQPFTRASTKAVTLASDQEIYIRMHMNTTGYSKKGFKGSVATGFAKVALASDFALDLAQKKPLPKGCAF